MKATELMIGDLVYGLYPDGSIYANPFRISAVEIYPTNKSPRIVTYGGYGFQEEHLEPIPLTPEILEKNGWKPSVNSCGIEYSMGDSGIIIIHRTLGETEFKWSMYNNHFGFDKKELSVHELQHALKLCGIDKEITL